jgi:hypothetical protein
MVPVVRGPGLSAERSIEVKLLAKARAVATESLSQLWKKRSFEEFALSASHQSGYHKNYPACVVIRFARLNHTYTADSVLQWRLDWPD